MPASLARRRVPARKRDPVKCSVCRARKIRVSNTARQLFGGSQLTASIVSSVTLNLAIGTSLIRDASTVTLVISHVDRI